MLYGIHISISLLETNNRMHCLNLILIKNSGITGGCSQGRILILLNEKHWGFFWIVLALLFLHPDPHWGPSLTNVAISSSSFRRSKDTPDLEGQDVPEDGRHARKGSSFGPHQLKFPQHAPSVGIGRVG